MPSNIFQITTQIKELAKNGNIYLARKLFDEMSQRDTITWNTMLTSYTQLGFYENAINLFQKMKFSNTKPDKYSFTSTLSACSGAVDINNGEKIHAQVIVLGCNLSLPVNNALVNMYGKCLRTCSAEKVFNEMSLKNDLTWCSLLFCYINVKDFENAFWVFNSMTNKVVVGWNTMIAGFGKCGDIEMCFSLFKDMLLSGYEPDQWTFSAVMNVCLECRECFAGYMVQCLIVKSGWSLAVEASNSILSFYAKLGSRDDFMKVNELIEVLTQVSFNAMIDAHMKFGDTHKASLVFQQACEKNVISWTSMISGYARNGEEELALSFFVAMMRDCFKPDDFAFGAVLQACSNLATLKHGQMVHCLVIHFGFHAYAYVGNGLINMYAKCGDIGAANEVFSDILDNDLVSWNALLFAFGLHGLADRALAIYEEMGKIGIKPDKVTFIALLVTCSHSGLIEKGRDIFESMSSLYGIIPTMDHVVCLVDMLGRGGYLEEARELGRKYTKVFESDISYREALFGACSGHGDLKMGAKLGGDLRVLNPRNEMNYVLLSNLYSASGQWEEVEMIRKSMIAQNVKKMPGCSWIEIESKVAVFVAGKDSNPHFEQICETMYDLEQGMKNPCFYNIEIE